VPLQYLARTVQALRTRFVRDMELTLGALIGVLLAVAHASAGGPLPPALLDLTACSVAAASGRFPRAAPTLLAALLALNLVLPPAWNSLGDIIPVIPILGLGIRERYRERSVFAAIFLVLVVVSSMRSGETDLMVAAVFWGTVIGVAWVIGDTVARHRAMHQVAGRIELIEQRTELARDLHDTVAHDLSVISLQAQESLIRGTPTVQDMEFVAEQSARAMNEMRSILHLLRSSDSAAETATWRLVRLEEVVARSEQQLRRAGFRVTTSVEGDLAVVPFPIVRTLDKVAKEATNNIIKHAQPGASVAIMMGLDDGEVAVAFVNPLVRRAPAADPDRPTLGVTGMTERVSTLGGSLSSGPSSGHWLTRVRIPLQRGCAATPEAVGA